MRLRTEQEPGKTIFIDDDSDETFYEMLASGDFPASMEGIVTEHELVGEVMHAKVTDGGSGWNSQMIERLERRRTDLKNALMEQSKKEIENDRTESTTS